MQKRHYGPLVITVLAILVIPLWWLSFPETTVQHNLKPIPVYLSQVIALTGFACFALSFVLSARIKKLEDFFGGLDRMYHAHHTLALTAFILLLLHPLLLASRWIPEESERILWYLFPVHRRIEINIGSYALWGMIVLTGITLLKLLPYHIWKITHKFLGIFLILGMIHIILLDHSFSSNIYLTGYILILSVAGAGSWFYKTVLFDFIIPKTTYDTHKLHKPYEEVLEIELSPRDQPVQFKSGQFFFFSFLTPGMSREAHPYTICWHDAKSGNIKIMVKALGDYTSRLNRTLKTGVPAVLEGPYGRFHYNSGKPDQIWIAGGVGVAPFLSWINNTTPWEYLRHTDFYYCVDTLEEAVYAEQFRNAEIDNPDFRFHLVCADEVGYLDVTRIPYVSRRDVFICGPRAMRAYLLKEFKRLKVDRNKIHYEDFDFM